MNLDAFSAFRKTISSKNRKVSLLNTYIFVLIKILYMEEAWLWKAFFRSFLQRNCSKYNDVPKEVWDM